VSYSQDNNRYAERIFWRQDHFEITVATQVFVKEGMYQNNPSSIQLKANNENAISCCILGETLTCLSQKMVKRLKRNENNAGHFSMFW
jgi:hypothetical protein